MSPGQLPGTYGTHSVFQVALCNCLSPFVGESACRVSNILPALLPLCGLVVGAPATRPTLGYGETPRPPALRSWELDLEDKATRSLVYTCGVELGFQEVETGVAGGRVADRGWGSVVRSGVRGGGTGEMGQRGEEVRPITASSSPASLESQFSFP